MPRRDGVRPLMLITLIALAVAKLVGVLKDQIAKRRAVAIGAVPQERLRLIVVPEIGTENGGFDAVLRRPGHDQTRLDGPIAFVAIGLEHTLEEGLVEAGVGRNVKLVRRRIEGDLLS